MKHGTLLTMISTQSLYIACRDCGHSATLPVRDLIDRLGHGAALRDVLAKTRCRKCHGRKPGEVHLERKVEQ